MNNYLVYKLQHYIRKGFFEKVSLQITFKNFKKKLVSQEHL